MHHNQPGKLSSSADSCTNGDAANCLGNGFQISMGTALSDTATVAEDHHDFELKLQSLPSNNSKLGTNQVNSRTIKTNLHSSSIQNATSSHHLDQHYRQQNFPASALMSMADFHSPQHSHHFNQSPGSNKSSIIGSITSSNIANNHLSRNHHAGNNRRPLGSQSISSNSSAISSSSSSPSAPVSPSSTTPTSSSQHGSLVAANGVYGAGYQNHSHQLTTASILPQQNGNHNGSNLQQQNTSRYKTELCRPFEENGTCKYGEKCQFAHGIGELRTLTRHPKYKTEFCRTFHTTGFCPYGPRCHFIHNSKTSAPPASLSLGTYGNLPFSQHTSHSASPSTSPISSTSTSTTANGLASSASSTASSSSVSPPSSTSCLLDLTIGNGCYLYGNSESDGGSTNNLCHRNQSILNSLLADSSESHLRKRATHFDAAITSPRSKILTSTTARSTSSSSSSSSSVRNENEGVSSSHNGSNNGCASENQRLFWLHSHMNESSRRPPAMCASGLISRNARRTWQMQA